MKRAGAQRLGLLGLGVAALACPTEVHAGEARAEAGDATHGRLDGAVALSLGAGVAAAARGPRLVLDGRVRALDSLGVFATYEEGAFGRAFPRRVVAAGFELRPLFWGRWLTGAESGVAFTDLTLDSLGLELGGAWLDVEDAPAVRRRAFHLGLGLEAPLAGRAAGPWLGLRAALRFGEDALVGGGLRDAADRGLSVALTFGWRAYVGERPARP